MSLKTVRRWAQSGKLKGKKVGSRGDWRFTREQLDRMIHADDYEVTLQRLLLAQAADIEAAAHERYQDYIGRQDDARHEWRRRHFVAFIKKAGNHLDDTAKGKKEISQLSTVLAETAIKHETPLEDMMDGVRFLGQALREAIAQPDILRHLTARRMHALDGMLALYLDILTAKLASAYEQQYQPAYAALRERDARYQNLFNSIEEGFCIIEILYDGHGKAYDHRFVEVNDAYQEIAQMKNPVGRTLREMEPNVSPVWTETYARVAATGKPHRSTEFSRSRQRWYDIAATRIGGPGSRLVAMLFTDVTEWRRMEEERVGAMQKVISTLESIDEAFFQVDANWNVELVNERFIQMTNLKREEIIGRNIGTTFPDENRPNTLYYKTLMQVMKTRQPAQFVDYYGARKRWIEVRAYPTENGLSAFVKDITRQRAAEESQIIMNQLSLERDELIKIGKAKDEFIGIASHQLRTPATAVKQYIGLLLNGLGGPLSESQQKFLETAYASNERQLKLINDLLKTAQIDADTYMLSRSSQNVTLLLRNTMAAVQPIFDQRNQRLVADGLDDEVDALVDPIEMDLVFSNLLENASKYSHDKATISISLRRKRKSVQLSFTDEGVGIAKEDQDRIFDKFTRVANELSDSTVGSGLGLYWVRHIVELHGGDISVTSRPGKGSTFTVTLPR